MAAASEPGSSEVPPELLALMVKPIWSTSVSVDTAYGYKDNLLLSATGEERSPFVRGSAELLMLRVSPGAFDFSFYAQAERSEYFDGITADHDAKAWVLTEAGFRLGERWKASLPVTGYYYDQAFDTSVTEVRRDVSELKVSGVLIAPAVRWNYLDWAWVEPQFAVERKVYEDGVNDSDIREGGLRLGFRPARDLEFRLVAHSRHRDFDERAQYSAAGRELVGTVLKVREREAEGHFEWRFGRAGQWTADTRVGLLEYRDNGSGYFSHRRRRLAHELEWKDERWLWRVGGAVERFDFDVQRVGAGIDVPARLAEDFSADLRLERRLGRTWTVFLAYLWQRRRSNEPIDAYRVNEGLLGARWSWER